MKILKNQFKPKRYIVQQILENLLFNQYRRSINPKVLLMRINQQRTRTKMPRK